MTDIKGPLGRLRAWVGSGAELPEHIKADLLAVLNHVERDEWRQALAAEEPRDTTHSPSALHFEETTMARKPDPMTTRGMTAADAAAQGAVQPKSLSVPLGEAADELTKTLEGHGLIPSRDEAARIMQEMTESE